MLKLSLMTMNMMLPVYMKLMLEHDMEEALELYEEMMDLIPEAGFEAVDVTSMEIDSFGFETVKRILKDRNLRVSSLIHFGNFCSLNEMEDMDRIEKGKQAVDKAIELESKVLMLVPQAQEGIEECDRQALSEALVRNWKPIIAYARKKGIHVVIEDTPDLRIPLCTTAEMKAVLNQVPGLELVYDSGNMILVGEEPVEYFDSFASCIGHIHLKDMMNVPAGTMFADKGIGGQTMMAAPSGTGLVDFRILADHIKRSGYDGYLTVEFAKDEDLEYAPSLMKAREYFETLLIK